MSRAKGKRLSVMPGQDATPVSIRQDNDEQGQKDTAKVGFYNVQDGIKGRDGGPYLDHVERQVAEVERARREDRKPADLNGPLPAATGTMLVVAALLPDNSTTSNPSMAAAPGIEAGIDDNLLGGNDAFADPISVLPVDRRTAAPEEETVEETPQAPTRVTDTSNPGGNDTTTGGSSSSTTSSSSTSSSTK